jgi:hypothetical protein
MLRNSILFFASLLFYCVAFSQSEEKQVAVTSRFAASKKARQHAYRMQLLPTGTSFSILTTGSNRIPKSLKSIRFPNGEKIRRQEIMDEAQRSLDSTYKEVSEGRALRDYRIPKETDYQRQRDLYMMGKRSTPYFSSQWTMLERSNIELSKNFTFRTRGLLRTHHEYRVDFLPSSVAWRIPAIDPWFCEPAELKFFQLRKLQGYGVDKFNYQPYETRKRVIIRKAFDVYFKHNETEPDSKGLSLITDYLDQNEFEILKAELEGGCSIEGTAERNRYLQTRRASILQRALHKYSAKKVKRDTVMLVDVLEQFRREVGKTQHRWLNKLSDDSILSIVNTNDSVRLILEPVFQIQRKASLRLVIAKRLTGSEQYTRLLNDMTRLVLPYNQYKKAWGDPEPIAKLMGMIEKLFEYHEDEYIDADEYDDALNLIGNDGYLSIFTAYHLLKRYEEKTWPVEKAATWTDYWQKYNVVRWLKKAQREAISLLYTARHTTERNMLLRMLTDFQAYSYEFIEQGLIPVEDLCDVIYPRAPMYMGLTLNQYAFLYEMSTRRNVPVRCMSSSQCVQNEPTPKDSTLNLDAFIESAKNEFIETRKYQRIGSALVRDKNFDTAPKSPYYFLLKEYYLKNNAAALSTIEYAGTGGDVVFNVFNLWHLISLNVDRFNPFENHFYDSAVQLNEMEKLINTLKRLDRYICKPQVNGMLLDYHLKMLYYLQHYPEPGNPNHAKLAESALKFIANYYKSRAKKVSPRLSLLVAKQLNDFNWLQGSNPGAWYGYEILHAVANARLLNDEEMKLYAHYLKLFNPQMKKVPKVGFQMEKLIQLGNEIY